MQVCRDYLAASAAGAMVLLGCSIFCLAGIKGSHWLVLFLFIGPFKHLKDPLAGIFSAACCVRHPEGPLSQGLGW